MKNYSITEGKYFVTCPENTDRERLTSLSNVGLSHTAFPVDGGSGFLFDEDVIHFWKDVTECNDGHATRYYTWRKYSNAALLKSAVNAPKMSIKTIFEEAEKWKKPEGFEWDEAMYYEVADACEALCVVRGQKLRKVKKNYRRLIYFLMEKIRRKEISVEDVRLHLDVNDLT